MTIAARYENGVFRPLENVKIEEGTIVEIRVPQEELRIKPKSVGELGFTGMWAYRDDITDGVTYVDGLRDKTRG